MLDFSGRWQTSFGPMELTQHGKRVQGTYVYMGHACTLDGKLAHDRLTFTYREPTVEGRGWFEMLRRGQAFSGRFTPDGSDNSGPWEGERIGFDGLWNSSFGLLRLVEEGEHVQGFYPVGGSSTIDGKRTGNRLTFSYKEPKARGRGRFELSADGLSFQGEWRPQGDSSWRPWTGLRVRAQPNLTWLVVLEAPWQRFLSDQEYSFGNMLREFFARVNGVEVRHRFFSNEASLRKCCRDVLYIAEPVVLVLATHAQPEGVTVDGQTISIASLVDSLRFAANLRLLHFSACLLMQAPEGVAALQQFANSARLPISGYKTSVDWGASAIIEFTYLDLILGRGLNPSEAAANLKKLLPFAGDKGPSESVYPPAGFHLVLPAATVTV